MTGRGISEEAAKLAKEVGRRESKKKVEEIERQQPVRGRSLSVNDFQKADIPEPPTIVEEVIAGGTITIIAGQHKVGKTLLGLHLAMAAAAGEDWLGFPTTMTPTFYLNYEVAEWSFQKRVRRAVHGFAGFGDEGQVLRQKVGLNLYVNSLPSWRLNHKGHLRQIAEEVASLQAGLLVVDPIRAAYTGARNDDREVDAVMQAILEDLVEPTGCAVILMHHMRKPAPGEQGGGSTWEVKGSGSWTDAADGIITLRRDRNDSSKMGRLVNMTLRHFESIDDFKVKLQPASLIFTADRAAKTEGTEEARLQKAFQMANFDERGGELTMADIADVVGVSRQFAQRRWSKNDWPRIKKVRTVKNKAYYRWEGETLPDPY